MQGKIGRETFINIYAIIDFLENYSFSEHAIIEVSRACYLLQREKKIFEYYPKYLSGKRQSDIGVLLGWSQGLVSILFTHCRTKIKFFKEWFSDDIRAICDSAKGVCTPREWSVIERLMAGIKMVDVAKEFKCTKFNICLLTKSGISKLKSKNQEAYYKIYELLSFIKILKSRG
jgi:hypothetical protein